MKRNISEQEAYLLLADTCAKTEHCEYEMLTKMQRWELPADACQRVIDRLKSGRYIDDERFARAFVKDKIHYNKWGRRKIQQALWQKHIDGEIQQQVLDEIAEKEYIDILQPLLKQKRKTTKSKNNYELNQKLIRFALSRGFDFSIIRQCLDVTDEELQEYTDETD